MASWSWDVNIIRKRIAHFEEMRKQPGKRAVAQRYLDFWLQRLIDAQKEQEPDRNDEGR